MGFVFDKKPTIEIDGRLYECDPADINLIEGVSQNYREKRERNTGKQ